MKDLAQNGNYSGAPKYLKQRDSLLEIPIDCVRKLCDAIDQDCSELVQLKHLKKYVEKCELPFDEGIVEKMFDEASQGRGQISEEKKQSPLTHEEVAAAVRARHSWNIEKKEWEIRYRPYRDYWIALLLTVNKKIFALPMPKIVP